MCTVCGILYVVGIAKPQQTSIRTYKYKVQRARVRVQRLSSPLVDYSALFLVGLRGSGAGWSAGGTEWQNQSQPASVSGVFHLVTGSQLCVWGGGNEEGEWSGRGGVWEEGGMRGEWEDARGVGVEKRRGGSAKRGESVRREWNGMGRDWNERGLEGNGVKGD